MKNGTCHAECHMGLRPTNADERPRGPVIPSEARSLLLLLLTPPWNDRAVG